MEKQTRKIRIDGENFMIVKPLKSYDKGAGSDFGDGFEKIGDHYAPKGLVGFLEDNWREGNKIRVICDDEIEEKIKEFYLQGERKEEEAKEKGVYGRKKKSRGIVKQINEGPDFTSLNLRQVHIKEY